MFAFVLLSIAVLQLTSAFKPSYGRIGALRSLRMVAEAPFTLVLIRHGESTWNDQNRFTGWADCPLSEKGLQEAKIGGQSLKEEGFKFDVAYTSYLKRAIKTCWICLEEMDQMN